MGESQRCLPDKDSNILIVETEFRYTFIRGSRSFFSHHR
jgi:hypothetical protein